MVNSQRFEHPAREQSNFDDFKVKDVYEIGVGRFPKEFERQWCEVIDRRFALILLMSFIIHFITAFYFAINPPTTTISSREIRRIQEQYASLVLDEKAISSEEEIEDLYVESKVEEEDKLKSGSKEGSSRKAGKQKGGRSEAKMATAEGRKEIHNVGVETRRKTRAQISKDVSSKGILGILSATSSAATGDEVIDVLGDVGSGGDNLDDVLNQLDGIKVADSETQGGSGGKGYGRSGGRRIKGARSTSGGGIDDLLTERGTARSTSVKRKGAIVVSNISAVENSDGIKSESRNADEVSAVVNTHNAAIQYCYQRELKRNPDLKGKLVIRFTIAPNGKVVTVKIVSSTLGNSRVERCVISRVKRWDDFGSIDSAKGNAVFRQVYTFGY